MEIISTEGIGAHQGTDQTQQISQECWGHCDTNSKRIRGTNKWWSCSQKAKEHLEVESKTSRKSNRPQEAAENVYSKTRTPGRYGRYQRVPANTRRTKGINAGDIHKMLKNISKHKLEPAEKSKNTQETTSNNWRKNEDCGRRSDGHPAAAATAAKSRC